MFILNKTNSIASHFISELRDVTVQQDRMRFRTNLERLGMLLAYEVSKTLEYKPNTVKTPMANQEVQLIENQPVLVTIMRAGLPFYQGFLNIFDQADNGFIGAFRGEYEKDHSFRIEMGYLVAPKLEGKTVILIDPMLATGKSLVEAFEGLKSKYGTPKKVHVVAAISSQAGVDFVKENIKDVSVWTGAVDPELNQKSYIVPGLGDAGDLSFGEKA
ncbi:MAG: uracil phosphoribosyltransferase [Arenicella sp.]|jgi:uracil phosphoribosyltransferase